MQGLCKKLQNTSVEKIPLSAPMAIHGYPVILFFTLIIFVLSVWRNKSRQKRLLPMNWPLVGMLLAILQNSHRIHAYLTQLLSECGGTFELKFPSLFNMDMLVTCDPANIHHIFSTKFSNYPKGPEFRKTFQILGDGIFNADFELWEFQRRTTLPFMSDLKFYTSLERAVWQKVETGLVPVLDYFSEQGIDVDLQDILHRFTLDNICTLVLDYDPCSLSIGLPYIPFEKALLDIVEVVLYRHLLPESIWKLQKWLNIGRERMLTQARKVIDDYIYPRISLSQGEVKDDDPNFLTTFKKAYQEKYGCNGSSRDFLRDSALGLIIAGTDTTSACLTWLLWLIAKNPSTEIKILEEIERVLLDDKKWSYFTIQESRKLIYLHGALCESLRLFPPGALEHKAPIEPDHLPSGHYVPKNKKIIVCFYSVGRMEAVWGKDCLEFKPERWISASGGIKHVPSYKFPAFNAGPRTCLGKEMAFIQMKMIAATIIYHYHIQLVEAHPVCPRDSVIHQMKHGLRVTLSKRNF